MPRYFSLAIALALVSAASAQELYITDCSLGCTSGAGGNQVFCSNVNVHENEVIELGFSLPIDPASLSVQTFQVIDVSNGTSAAGSLVVSPLDPTRVTFEPLSDFSGGVGFTLQRNRTYEILSPGEAQGDAGPFITSTTGEVNQSRFLCAVLASEGVLPFVRSECVTTPNSAGSGALMSASGEPSVLLNDLTLETTGLPPGTFGVYVIGSDAAFSPLGAGSLCVGGAFSRLGATQSSAAGDASFGLDLGAIGAGISVTAGSTWRFQHVFRDLGPMGPVFSTSDAVRVLFLF